jgi:dTDP-glucose 4,6-dehydratase
MKLLVTGSAGFIGSHLVRFLLRHDPGLSVVSLDNLTYAGNTANLEDIPGGLSSDRHRFVRGSICDAALVDELVSDGIDGIINLAACTHVDRALYNPEAFITNNVEGVLVLLRAALKHRVQRLLQVSTDEVYGSATPDAPCDENAALRPGNYYASSKAAADLYITAALNHTAIDAVIIRGCNNFGPRQYPEKLIPFFTRRILRGESLPLYGDGRQMRDWLFVDDFCRAIWTVFTDGASGEIYNAAAGSHISNLDLSRRMIDILDADPALIVHVDDRPGHDFCYAVTRDKIAALGWQPCTSFDSKLKETIFWYRDNEPWVDAALSQKSNIEDERFFERHYKNRT